MDIRIRNETEADYRDVEVLTREAFWNLYVPGCDEHYLVHAMRSHPDFIKELDFVAELGGRIVGSILYTRSWVTDEQARVMEIVTFGPVCVHPEYQRRGIGGALIQHTRTLVRERGVNGIVILGDPHNYCKHGFKSARDLNISDMNGDYPLGMLALELNEGAFGGHQWKFRHSDVYDLNAAEAAEFDKGFPHKEKGYKYSQDLFSILVRSHLK